jgi:hypothetical protein
MLSVWFCTADRGHDHSDCTPAKIQITNDSSRCHQRHWPNIIESYLTKLTRLGQLSLSLHKDIPVGNSSPRRAAAFPVFTRQTVRYIDYCPSFRTEQEQRFCKGTRGKITKHNFEHAKSLMRRIRRFLRGGHFFDVNVLERMWET